VSAPTSQRALPRWLSSQLRTSALPAGQRLAFGWARPRLRFASDGPVLILSPHLDDAVLDCFTVLTSGVDVRVVNVFAGLPAPGVASEWDRRCGATSSAEHLRARIAEDERTLGELGCRPVNLPFLDVQYGWRDPTRITMAALDRAVADAVPAVSVAYAPAALGEGHVDHRLVRAYGRALAHIGIPVRLYADLPYAVRTGWPAWVRDQRAHAPGDPALPFALRSATSVRVVTLDNTTAQRKLAALRAYASQFEALNEDDRLADPETLRFEVFWSLGRTG
jgi:LmbE family N-acetylglucosaminyl deacetylase